MSLTTIMDAIASAGASFTKTTYAYPSRSIEAPCLVVGYPTLIDFDMTFKRGADKMTFPVWFVIGKGDDGAATRDRLSTALLNVTGVKAVLDGNLGGTVSSARTTDATIEELAVSGVVYIVIKYDLEVIT
jgi:hypothetical protein